MIRIDKDSYMKGGAAERDKKVIKSWELAELPSEENEEAVDLRQFLTEHLGEGHEAVNAAVGGDAEHPLSEQACEALLRAFDPRAEVEAKIVQARAAAKKAAEKAAEKTAEPGSASAPEPEPANEREAESRAQSVLSKAKERARGILSEAEREADEMLSSARRTRDTAEFEAEELLGKARRDAETELREAREHADAMLDEAAAKRQSVFESARNEGYSEGVAASRTALLKVRVDYEGRLRDFFEQARTYNELRNAELEKNVLALSLEVAESVLDITLDRDSEPFFALVRRAIGQLNAKTRFTLRLNKREYDRFMESGEDAMKERLSEVPFSVICDGSLEPGALLLQADEGAVDAGVKAQLERAKKVLGLTDGEA